MSASPIYDMIRFGPVPETVAAQVVQPCALDELERLHRRAVVVDSLALFAQELQPTPGLQSQP